MDGYHHHIWSQVTKVAKHRTLKTKIVSHKMTKIFPCVLSGLWIHGHANQTNTLQELSLEFIEMIGISEHTHTHWN
jgi:hypothetical protein